MDGFCAEEEIARLIPARYLRDRARDVVRAREFGKFY